MKKSPKDKRSSEFFQRLKGENKIRLALELTDLALEVLIAGIKERQPSLGLKAQRQEVERCLWDVPSRVLGPSFRL